MNDEIKKADEIVKALRWLAKDTEFVFAAENLNDAADLIESMQAEVTKWKERHNQAALNFQQENRENAKLQAQLTESERKEKENAELIRKIYFATDKDLCDCCRKIVRMIEIWWGDDEKGSDNGN